LSLGSVEGLAAALRESGRTVVLTGAGVSTESGIPDFRSDAGVWARADPMEVGSIEGFRESPRRFYDFWSGFFAGLHRPGTGEVRPSAMHVLLAELEARGTIAAVITQNVDSLHQRAGSRRVIEVHGNWERTRCTRCNHTSNWQAVLSETRPGAVPTCELCGGMVRPDVVLFGERLGPSFAEAEDETRAAELFIAMGTSLEVAPVSDLPHLAAEHGAKVAIVNRDATSLDRDADLVVRGELGAVAAALRAAL
jgi:NAD-dependent deacetylase